MSFFCPSVRRKRYRARITDHVTLRREGGHKDDIIVRQQSTTLLEYLNLYLLYVVSTVCHIQTATNKHLFLYFKKQTLKKH